MQKVKCDCGRILYPQGINCPSCGRPMVMAKLTVEDFPRPVGVDIPTKLTPEQIEEMLNRVKLARVKISEIHTTSQAIIEELRKDNDRYYIAADRVEEWNKLYAEWSALTQSKLEGDNDITLAMGLPIEMLRDAIRARKGYR